MSTPGSPSGANGPDDARPGLSLGPMTFVPEVRVTGRNDPWAHRKGEPRVFALLWAVYLLAAATITVFSVRALGYPRASQFVFAGLSMLTLSMIGIMVLWPALRLSQVRPRAPTVAALLDLAVVLLPVHAIVWPLSMLTGWTWPVTLGLLLVVSGWGSVAGGVLALTLHQRNGAWSARLLAMLLLLVLCLAAPAFRVLTVQAGRPVQATIDLLSPLSALWSVGLAPEGVQPKMDRAEWLAGAVPLAAGVILLVASGVLGAMRTPPSNAALPEGG